MATTVKMIRAWFKVGVEENYDFMIVVCDGYSYEDYPVYATSENFREKYYSHNGVNMQRVIEVYDLHYPSMEEQLSEYRALYFPDSWDFESDLHRYKER